MDKSTRICVIRESRDALQGLPWDDADLVLKEFGWHGMPDGGDCAPSLLEVLRGGADDDLLALASHLSVEGSMASDLREAPAPATGPLLVFASHLARHKAEVGAVEAELATFGIKLFVAHTAIEPDQVWRDEILKTLDTAHAGVAFVHEGFIESTWCDQEVGWLLGRRVPVFSLKFDAAPYGPLGERQAIAAAAMRPTQMADAVLDVVTGRAELRSHLATSLVMAMQKSHNFQTTDRVWARLRNLRNLDEKQCQLLMSAVEDNPQVAHPSAPWPSSALDHDVYAVVIPRFIEQQPGASAVRGRLDQWAAALEQG